MLVGALGDERIGLDQDHDAQQLPDGGTDATTDQSGPAALQRARRSGSDSGNLAAPEVAQDADPAMLVGALGDERTGLEVESDAAAEQDDVASRVDEPRRPQGEGGVSPPSASWRLVGDDVRAVPSPSGIGASSRHERTSPSAELGASPLGASIVVLARRATRVPGRASGSGIQPAARSSS